MNLDDDVLEDVRRYSRSRSLALGKALSELVRRGLEAPAKTRVVNGLVVFDLPPGGPKVTLAQVRKLEAEER